MLFCLNINETTMKISLLIITTINQVINITSDLNNQVNTICHPPTADKCYIMWHQIILCTVSECTHTLSCLCKAKLKDFSPWQSEIDLFSTSH